MAKRRHRKDDPDETEGRRLARDKAEAEARFSIAYTRGKRLKGRPVPHHGSGGGEVPPARKPTVFDYHHGKAGKDG